MEELKNVGEDVKRRVEDAEKRQMKRRNEVNGWLNSLTALEREVNEILEKGDQEIQKKCLRNCCTRNCRFSYKIGKMAREKIPAVSELKNKGHFDVVADILPSDPVDEKPMEKAVGLNLMFGEIWRWLEDEKVGIIGLYGMGGVGKTTLLKKINNEFLKTKLGFDVVIWVVVSKQAKAETVQEVILNKLEVPRYEWENRSRDEKGQKIFNILKTKKFVLLLDDVWERLDLTEVGVPHPNGEDNMSKLIFTTRSEDVCHVMEAHKHVKVECLASDEALALFRLKVGEDTFNSHPQIPALAKEIVKECKGLPLALITIGRAMVDKKTPQRWDRAVQVLRTYPSTFAGMEDKVFPILAFSYDSLYNDTIKSCFRYCSMFPSDYEILEDELIELWIGEGFLIESYDIQRARNEGYDVIESLKVACLLESGESEKHVKMHDMIRDMALWLTTKTGENKKKVVVKERAWWLRAREFAEWREAQMISLWDIRILPLFDRGVDGAQKRISFPNLETFFVRRSLLKEIPPGFLEKMHLVRVLDLSYNYSLERCSQVHQLANLEYLNMSFTNICSLWGIVQGLKKLRCLILNFTHVEVITPGLISDLSSLQLFSMHGGSHHSDEISLFDRICEENILCGGKKALLQELESLECINEISIILHSDVSVKKLLSSYKLQSCIRKLHLQRCSKMTSLELSPACVQTMVHLETLQISSCNDLKEVKINEKDEGKREFISRYSVVLSEFCKLHEVHIISCSKLLNLTWLIHAPCLQLLAVSACKSMEEVIGDDDGGGRASVGEENSGLFSRLTTLQLEGLPKLKSICNWVLPLPSLTMIYVHSCESLRKLPFDSNTGKNSLKKIQAEQSWWEGLQWEDESIKQSFSPFFMPLEYMDLYQVLGYGY